MPALERLVFFGTPEFALPALEALVAAGRRPALVVTQPARPAGRGRRLVEPPVALRALALGLAVAQPERVRDPGFLADLGKLAPDLGIVVAFGQIFPRALLDLPRLGCINVHASLLPRWRGAAPIPAAIAAGDAETGISIQRLEAGLDTGPVLAERRTPIGADETAGELSARLSRLGADLLLEVLSALELGSATATPQDEAQATYAPKLAGPRTLDLARPAHELAREVRAFHPEPGATLETRREPLKVLRAAPSAAHSAQRQGTVVGIGGGALALATGEGTVLELLVVQRPGGRPISGGELANGWRLRAGDRLA